MPFKATLDSHLSPMALRVKPDSRVYRWNETLGCYPAGPSRSTLLCPTRPAVTDAIQMGGNAPTSTTAGRHVLGPRGPSADASWARKSFPERAARRRSNYHDVGGLSRPGDAKSSRRRDHRRIPATNAERGRGTAATAQTGRHPRRSPQAPTAASRSAPPCWSSAPARATKEAAQPASDRADDGC